MPDRQYHVVLDVAGRRNAMVSLPMSDETEAQTAYKRARINWQAGIATGDIQVRLIDAEPDDWQAWLAGQDGRLS